jgi:mono/diheme cytochrome c family protein
MGRLLGFALVASGVIAAAGWAISRPAPLPDAVAEGHSPDANAGALVFHASGCASCHAAPNALGEDKRVLAGGHALASDFGTFYAPNISPDPDAGIGGWSLPEFARAVRSGVSPSGQHYFPAFPYTSYHHMTDVDVANLYAYMQTLPVSAQASQPHEIAFPFSIRRAVGVWKALFVTSDFAVSGELSPVEERGRYLSEGLGHCAECHTARNALGGLDRAVWMAGAPNPSGPGRIPNITPAELDWSDGDLMAYLTTGLTPEYDSAGGTMASVIENLAKLPEDDRAAIIAYLRLVPPVP